MAERVRHNEPMKLDDVASRRYFAPQQLGEMLLLVNDTALLAFWFFIAKHVAPVAGPGCFIVGIPYEKRERK